MIPRHRIDLACETRGRGVVLQACLDLLQEQPIETSLLEVLGGPEATWCLDKPANHYWLRVWAVRGLQWCWDDTALPALTAAMSDEAWRVRELAARVAAWHRLDLLQPSLVALQRDPVPRVRAAAESALARLAGAGPSPR